MRKIVIYQRWTSDMALPTDKLKVFGIKEFANLPTHKVTIEKQ